MIVIGNPNYNNAENDEIPAKVKLIACSKSVL